MRHPSMEETLVKIISCLLQEEWEFTVNSKGENTSITIPIWEGNLILYSTGEFEYVEDV